MIGFRLAAQKPPEAKRTTGEFTTDAALTAKVKSAIATDVGARTAVVEGLSHCVEFLAHPSGAESGDEAATAATDGSAATACTIAVRVRSFAI